MKFLSLMSLYLLLNGPHLLAESDLEMDSIPPEINLNESEKNSETVTPTEVSDLEKIDLSSKVTEQAGPQAEDSKALFLKGKKTSIKDPFELRDPFKRELGKRRIVDGRPGALRKKDDSFSNILDISSIPIENIKVVGVLLGNERRAMAKIKDKDGKQLDETVLLKEGMILGIDKAELKAILPGGVVLVEKIKNVYDETEYLETIIPVSPE